MTCSAQTARPNAPDKCHWPSDKHTMLHPADHLKSLVVPDAHVMALPRRDYRRLPRGLRATTTGVVGEACGDSHALARVVSSFFLYSLPRHIPLRMRPTAKYPAAHAVMRTLSLLHGTAVLLLNADY